MTKDASFSVEDVVYLTPTGDPLLARLYRPAGKGPFPAAVDIHGGRWCAETRLTNAAIDEALAASGIFVMAPDFRMPPRAQYPLPVADINYGIRWLKRNVDEYDIHLPWIGGLGTSSGAHQLLLNALVPNSPDYTTEAMSEGAGLDAALAYAVICWPVSDPLARYHYAISQKMEIHIQSHHAYWPDEEAMAIGNPQLIVAGGKVTHLPPLLLVQGSHDVILTPDMAERFASVYQAAGGRLVLQKFDGQGHTFITKDPHSPASRQALHIINDFIHAQTDRATEK